MKFTFSISALTCAAAFFPLPPAARADVIVLANNTNAAVEARFALPGDEPRSYKLDPREALPVPVVDEATVEFNSGKGQKRYRLAANSIAYFFTKDATPGVVELAEKSFSDKQLPANPKPAARDELVRLRKVGYIPVKLLVDDDEPAVKAIWEKRLNDRLEQASDVLQQFCLVRLKVVERGAWNSQDGVTDFRFSIREFEKENRPGAKAALVIGFSSQYEKIKGRVHMGGTRGPLYPYILIREWSQHVPYYQRVEIVVHEVGHVLGAVHSPDMYSVMRPLVSNAPARGRSAKIGFDPLNALAMFLFCEELRLHKAQSLRDFRPQRRELLSRIYRQMQEQMPKDDSPRRYIAFLQRASQPLPASPGSRDGVGRVVARHLQNPSANPTADPSQANTLVSAARIVLEALLRAAEANHDLSARAKTALQEDRPSLLLERQSQDTGLEGDRLAEYYVRSAAATAGQLPPQHAQKAFLLGLAIALADADDFQANKALIRFVKLIEPEEQKKRRLAVLGNPTMHGRGDLARHFTISAALAALVGEDGARAIAVAKETADSRGGTGFSFRDLAADLAGISFAKHLIDEKLKLADVVVMFSVDAFLPDAENLPEGLSQAEFVNRFGSTTDRRFLEKESGIEREILALPGYAALLR